ncbi:MAG: non-ribosomal peptide synthetase, partial [Moorea sp. SIO2I5]|nr:non-ribosomal peptide synthetase [Moorena sp. SIO2I5]
FTAIIAIFKIILLRYTGQKDIIVGSLSTDSLRETKSGSTEKFYNPIALRTNLRGDLSARELLRGVANTIEEARENRDYPFEKLVDEFKTDEGLSRSSIFPVMLVLCNGPFCMSKIPIEKEHLKEHLANISEQIDRKI